MSSSSVVARSCQDGPGRRRRARATTAPITTSAASTQGHHRVPSPSSPASMLLVGAVSGAAVSSCSSGGAVSSGGALSSGGAVSSGLLRRLCLFWRRAGVLRWPRRRSNRRIRWERRCDRRRSTAAVTRPTRTEQHDQGTGDQRAASPHKRCSRGERGAPAADTVVRSVQPFGKPVDVVVGRHHPVITCRVRWAALRVRAGTRGGTRSATHRVAADGDPPSAHDGERFDGSAATDRWWRSRNRRRRGG